MVALNLPSKLIMLSTAATSSLLCFTTSSTEALNLGKMFGSPIARSPRRVAHAHAHGHGAIYAEKKWGGRFSGLWINDGYYVDNLIVVKCHDPRLPGKYWFLQRDSKKDTLYKIHPNHKNIGLRANSYAEHALRYQPQNVELRLDQVQFQEQTPGVFVVIEQAVVHHHVHSPVHAFVHSPVHGVIHGHHGHAFVHGHHGHAFVHSPGHVVQHHIASPGHVLIHQPVVRPPHHVFPGTPILSPQHIHHHVKIDVVVKFEPEYNTGIGKWVCKCTNTDATDGKAIEVGVLYKYNVLYKHGYKHQRCVRLLQRWDKIYHIIHLPYHRIIITELETEFNIRLRVRPSKIDVTPVKVVSSPDLTPTTAPPGSDVVSPSARSDASVGTDPMGPEMVDAGVGTESKKPKKADASVGTDPEDKTGVSVGTDPMEEDKTGVSDVGTDPEDTVEDLTPVRSSEDDAVVVPGGTGPFFPILGETDKIEPISEEDIRPTGSDGFKSDDDSASDSGFSARLPDGKKSDPSKLDIPMGPHEKLPEYMWRDTPFPFGLGDHRMQKRPRVEVDPADRKALLKMMAYRRERIAADATSS